MNPYERKNIKLKDTAGKLQKSDYLITVLVDSMKSQNNNKRNYEQRRERYGNMLYYETGIKDRIFTGEFKMPDTTIEDSINSYIKGYYNGANDQLIRMIRYDLVTERVLKLSDNPDIDLETILNNVGYYDGFNINIVPDKLPEIIRNNHSYQKGYQKAVERKKIKSRIRGRK